MTKKKLSPAKSILRHNRRLIPPSDIQIKLSKEFKDAQDHLQDCDVNSSSWRRAKPQRCQEHLTLEKVGRIGIAHMQGVRATMEDRHLVTEIMIQVRGTTLLIPIYGIFDGHGGACCAEYLKQNFANYLKEHLEAALAEALSDSEEESAVFNVLTLAFVDLGAKYRKSRKFSFNKGGSTANIAIIYKNNLWVSNVGDTRAILALNGEAVALSEDAKPALEKYRKGVENRLSKVIDVEGVPRVGGNLATARAIGHSETKSGVNPRAKVIKYPLNHVPTGKNFLVIACDGLWDVASSVEVASTLHDLADLPPEEIASLLAKKAFEAGSSDNVSILITPLN